MARTMSLVTAVLVVVLTPSLLAERPSLPHVRDAEATHILVGRVKNVYERNLRTGRHGRGTIEGHYLLEIEIDKVERGRGFAPKDLAYVRCWRVTRSGPTITPGASGHGPIPEAGDYVRAFVAKGPYSPTSQEDNGLAAVYPNGFEILDAAARASKATRPQVTYQWPPWVEDLNPDQPGAQPGFDIHAENPHARPDDEEDLRYVRLHITPGEDDVGDTRVVRSVHVRLPGGWPVVVESAAVLPSATGWTTAPRPDGRGFSFAAASPENQMPATGLVFAFAVKADVLATATWRGIVLRLSNAASHTPPRDLRDKSLVCYVSWGRRVGRDGAVDFPIRLPYGR